MRGQTQTQIVWPKPSKPLIILMVSLVAAYVVQLLLLRAGQSWVVDLYLTPSKVFERGYVWQPLTYMWLHSPESPFHMLLNLVWLWMFGSQLEKWWGTKRFMTGYFIFGLSGAALILLIGGLSLTGPMRPLLGAFWTIPHLGASGAVIGITVAWGLTFANREMNFLLIGAMKGRTFVLIVIAFELLTALSFSAVSSAAHFGGIIGAFVLCRGWWRPSKWTALLKRAKLMKQRKKLENDLRVIEGGRPPDPDDPKYWN